MAYLDDLKGNAKGVLFYTRGGGALGRHMNMILLNLMSDKKSGEEEGCT